MSSQVCVCSVLDYYFCKNVGSSLYEQIYFSIDLSLCSTQSGVLDRDSSSVITVATEGKEGRGQNKCTQHIYNPQNLILAEIHYSYACSGCLSTPDMQYVPRYSCADHSDSTINSEHVHRLLSVTMHSWQKPSSTHF